MDYSSYVNTTLDLNSNHMIRFIDEAPTQDLQAPIKTESALAEELKRVSSENKKLTEMLTMVCEKYNKLHTQLKDYMSENNSPSRKRKSESSNNSEASSTDDESYKKQKDQEPAVKAKVSKICVRTETSDAGLVVKDGYQWRKYGQKVTRDNPCPRAYFKCSFAPTCPVKKKVQRSVEDQSVLVATYEGEHNHPSPSQAEVNSSSNRLAPASLSSTGPASTINFDLAKPKSGDEAKAPARRSTGSPDVTPQLLVEQMASSLTKDPNFTAALAAAISGKFFHQNTNQKW